MIFSKKLTTYEKIFFLFVGILSLLIFTHYVQKNMYTHVFDEHGYFLISSQIMNHGLFSISEPLRTYMYPLFIAFFRVISFGNDIVAKLLFSIFQYAVFIFTILFIANTAWKIKPKKIVLYTIIPVGVLNPYLVQSTTLYLTDLLSSCIIIFSVIFAASANLNKGRNIFVAVGFLFIDLMIRPSNAIFFAPVGIILLIRLFKKEFKLSFKVLVVGVSQLLFLIPQLYNNGVHLHRWTPLLAANLYKDQTTWSVQYLKYATVLIQGENPQLFYNNPHHPFQPGDTTTIFQLIHENFGVFLYTIFAHTFGVIDWGYVDSYIQAFYPLSRILGSVYLYAAWLIIVVGILVWITGFFNRNKENLAAGNGGFVIASLLGTTIIYTAFIATTCVESRFGYPIFLLLLIFLGWGGEYLVHGIMDSKTPFAKFVKALIYVVIFAVFTLILFYLSYRLDLKTGRIDWRTVFPFLPK